MPVINIKAGIPKSSASICREVTFFFWKIEYLWNLKTRLLKIHSGALIVEVPEIFWKFSIITIFSIFQLYSFISVY